MSAVESVILLLRDSEGGFYRDVAVVFALTAVGRNEARHCQASRTDLRRVIESFNHNAFYGGLLLVRSVFWQ